MGWVKMLAGLGKVLGFIILLTKAIDCVNIYSLGERGSLIDSLRG